MNWAWVRSQAAGPEVVGYEDSHEFEDVEPQGEEEIVVDADYKLILKFEQ